MLTKKYTLLNSAIKTSAYMTMAGFLKGSMERFLADLEERVPGVELHSATLAARYLVQKALKSFLELLL